MILFGTAVGSRDVYGHVALPSIRAVTETEAAILSVRDAPSIAVAYNQLIQEALSWGDDVEAPTPHDLRHFYASMLIRSGEASPKVVAARMGHSSIKVTYDTYGHLFSDEEDRTRQAVENFFSAERERPSSGLG